MTSPAPAAVPSEEEIQFVLAQPLKDNDWVVEKARAVLALFAPILAEKEREIERLQDIRDRRGCKIIELSDRALAAEAAVAGMGGKIAKALPDIAPAVEDWLFNSTSDQDTAAAIAAAIRAQGE